MPRRRNIFLHGLSITLRRFPAFLWTYIFNLGLALLFSLHLYGQLNAVMSHSLAAQRLVDGFGLGTAIDSIVRISDGSAGAPLTSYSGIPLYLLLYFILVPGTLFCYLADAPARLSTLLHQGLRHFWRFVRITILTLIASTFILGPLSILTGKWSAYIDNHLVGRNSFLLRLTGLIVLFLAASVLRLYFDLVEVYTVQLGLHLRSNGKPDRRIRRALGPALRTLRDHFSQAWPIFLFLTIVGAGAVFITARIAMHMLAQPRVWPMFLIAQLGLFLMLFTRFWQRGVETSLAHQNPIVSQSPSATRPIAGMVHPIASPHPRHPSQPAQTAAPAHPSLHSDPIPDPEPASPSLDEPDPGVFHHTPTKPPE